MSVRLGCLVPYLHYNDAAAMIDWYGKVFGFEEIGRWADASGKVTNAEMRCGDTELWMDGGPPKWAEPGADWPRGWIGVWVDDPDAMYELLQARGVEVDPPVDHSYGVRSVSVKDPEGYSWGFMRRI